MCAAGAILHYLQDTQRAALDHLDRPAYYDRAGDMVLDAVTVRNLEVIDVDAEDNVLVVKGAVPGPNGGYVVVRRSKR